MVILHAFLALVTGFAVVILAQMAFDALTRLEPGWASEEGKRQLSYRFVHLGSSFLSAASGGYGTAWAAATNPLVHALALALIVLALAALSALQTKGNQPVWLQLALVAIAPLGVLAGGLVRLRVLGIL